MAVRDPLEPDRNGDPLTGAEPGRAAAAPTGTDAVQELLGHRFARPELLREALTHRSAALRRGRGSNERLEFMGDRVLGLVVAEWLVERFPQEQEGELGRRLAHLVSQPVLAAVADSIGLGAALAVSPGEARAGVTSRATVRADALEAAIGALFLDGGLDVARRFVRRAWQGAMEGQASPPRDPKTSLQEWAQKRGLPLPSYNITERSGPPHAPRFTLTVRVGPHDAEGSAGTRRAAEQQAAAALLRLLEIP
jgi:ribonuclease III